MVGVMVRWETTDKVSHMPDNLSLSPATHIKVAGENRLHKVVLRLPHAYHGMHTTIITSNKSIVIPRLLSYVFTS